ncbi:MAG: hypothetical protein LBU50_06155, partial [Cellulomonas sp.]|nr:hypothetical protein [Cellulomonas sp.]
MVAGAAVGAVAVLVLVAVLWHPWTTPAPEFSPLGSQQDDHGDRTGPQVPGAYPDIVNEPIMSAPVPLCAGAVSGDYQLRRFEPVPLVTADIDAGFASAVVVVPDDDSYNNFAVRPADEPDICGFDSATGETTWTLDLSTVGIQNPVMWGYPAASSDYMVVRMADVVVDADDEVPAGCGDNGEIPCGHAGEDGWAHANETETMWLFTVDLDSGDIVSQTSMPLFTLDSRNPVRYVDGVVVVEETVAKPVGGYTGETVGRRDTDL